MGGSPFRAPLFNSREEALSGDLGRISSCASKALQDEMLNEQLDTTGAPINVFTKAPTTTGNAGAFTVAIGAGEALVNDGTGVGSDDSAFKVCQWPAQTVGPFTAPDVTNGRVDLVCLTPGTAQADNATRNVLLDPVARTFAPASVPKTLVPVSPLSIVTGVASATPVPPAVPSGSVAILEVFVEPASADASAWPITPRLHRKAGYPFSGLSPTGQSFSGGVGVPIVYAPQCGILRGCGLGNAAVLGVINGSVTVPGKHSVLIDGEIIEFAQTLGASPDTINPPVGPANANYDTPYFLYLVGGRNLPSNSLTGSPVQLVASVTPPDLLTGRPTAAIGTARGTTQSAVFVGCGFMLKGGSTFRGVDYREGSWAWAGTGGGPFSQNQDLTNGAYTILGAPSIADEMVLGAGITFPGGSEGQVLIGDYEEQIADPGAVTLTKNGVIRTRIAAGVVNVANAIVTNVRTGVQAYHIPGIRRLG
jgi:hypothetical protein